MSSDIIKVSRNTENAPINSVSTQTVAFSHYNNFSAQLPVDPKTGEVVIGDIKDLHQLSPFFSTMASYQKRIVVRLQKGRQHDHQAS